MLLKRINNWFTHFQQYFFVYKKGFYELSYLGNSPEAMVKSLMKMPFVTHNEKEQTLITNNPFAQGIMHYQELEEGLWIIFSEMTYKANVSFKPVYDQFIPCDYYQVGYSYNKNEVSAYGLKVNEAVFPHKSWAIYKRTYDKNATAYYYFKNTVSTDIGVYFSKSWADKHLTNNQQFIQSKFSGFFEGSSNYIIWPETSSHYEKKREELKTTIITKGNSGAANLLQLKIEAIGFISNFIEKYRTDDIEKKHFEIPGNDRLRVMKIEKHLCENVEKKFEGIDLLAQKFYISPTKLKSDFKLMFGKPVFQYFQEKQMLLAKELLKNENVRIKELAQKFGYENAGKFSLTYKKHFNILPSEELKSA